jgi:hypothetical protein
MESSRIHKKALHASAPTVIRRFDRLKPFFTVFTVFLITEPIKILREENEMRCRVAFPTWVSELNRHP